MFNVLDAVWTQQPERSSPPRFERGSQLPVAQRKKKKEIIHTYFLVGGSNENMELLKAVWQHLAGSLNHARTGEGWEESGSKIYDQSGIP